VIKNAAQILLKGGWVSLSSPSPSFLGAFTTFPFQVIIQLIEKTLPPTKQFVFTKGLYINYVTQRGGGTKGFH
jgi:hypothetical protein